MTWNAYAVDGNRDGRRNVYAPADAIMTAGRYVTVLRSIVGADKALLLAAFNAGPGSVQNARGVPNFAETRAYVANGLRYMRALPHKR
jgi:membrane-bound lytic murein transglycosylase B